MSNILWGQREGHYCLVIRQINKVKGYEVNFYPKDNMWGVVIGFVKTKKEAKIMIEKHKEIIEEMKNV